MTPFEVAKLDLRGRVVRLGPVVDDILNRHDYPVPVAKLLGEAVVLTVMLGSALKIEGRLILQTSTDGPVRMLVVDLTVPDKVRAYARFDAARVEIAGADAGKLLGHGHLAMTIDQGPELNRYQGLVALNGGDLEAAAHEYFANSEQIPTRVRLAVAEEFRAASGGPRRKWRVRDAGGGHCRAWRAAERACASASSGERRRVADIHPGDAPPGTEPHRVKEDDAWVEGRALMETVEDLELVDPDLSSERLLYRLFHEPGVRVFNSVDVLAQCSCSRPRVEAMLKSFTQDDRDHMVKDGEILVTCEFCSTQYKFHPEEVGAKADL